MLTNILKLIIALGAIIILFSCNSNVTTDTNKESSPYYYRAISTVNNDSVIVVISSEYDSHQIGDTVIINKDNNKVLNILEIPYYLNSIYIKVKIVSN